MQLCNLVWGGFVSCFCFYSFLEEVNASFYRFYGNGRSQICADQPLAHCRRDKQSYKLQDHLSLQIDYEDKYCYWDPKTLKKITSKQSIFAQEDLLFGSVYKQQSKEREAESGAWWLMMRRIIVIQKLWYLFLQEECWSSGLLMHLRQTYNRYLWERNFWKPIFSTLSTSIFPVFSM